MDNTNDLVGVVVVNYNASELTAACITTLMKTTHAQMRIYLVQYGKKLKTTHDQVRDIPVEKNLGFSGLHNIGIQHALHDGCDYVMLLNNDTEVDVGFIQPLIAEARNDAVGFVSPKIYFSKGREYQPGYEKSEQGHVVWYGGGVIDWQDMYAFHWRVDEVDHANHWQVEPTDFATGCCMLARADVIRHIGQLDEKYFLYMEDVEWSLRAARAGYTNMFVPESIVWHYNAGSTGGSGSEIHQYYQDRNRIYFGLRHAPIGTKVALINYALKNLDNAAVRDALLHRMGKRHED